MSVSAEKIKIYFLNGLWDEARVEKAYSLGKITKEEMEEIFQSKEEIENA